MTTARFESIGAFFPEKIVTTDELMSWMVNPQPINVTEITGIRNRRMLQKQESSLTAATGAARNCLQRSRYAANEIDIVISCSISRGTRGHTRHYFDPALSLFIKKEVGMNAAMHFDVSNACSGMMTGIHLLTDMIKAGVVKNGMVVSGEQISCIAETATKEIQQPWDPQFGSLTVGDSGAAVILDGLGNSDDKIDYIELTTCAEYSELCIGMPSDKTPHYALYTNNAEMHKKERLSMWPVFQSKFLEQRGANFSSEQFDYIIQHQVGLRFVKTVNGLGAEYFQSPMPEAINCVEDFGNTATTSHFIALHTHLQQNKLKPRTKILMVPAASGLVTGCLSATLSSLEV